MVPPPLLRSAVLYIARLPATQVPAQYRGWYADAERCLGLRGDYDRVKWYTTPHPWGGANPRDTTFAMWQPPNRITVNSENALDSAMLVHESIHDILSYQRIYEQGEAHPSQWYGPEPGKCSYKFHPRRTN